MLRAEIRRVWEENFRVYGVRKFGLNPVFLPLGEARVG